MITQTVDDSLVLEIPDNNDTSRFGLSGVIFICDQYSICRYIVILLVYIIINSDCILWKPVIYSLVGNIEVENSHNIRDNCISY